MKQMKKWLCLLLAVTLLVAFTACGKDKGGSTDNGDSTATTTTTTTPQPSDGDELLPDEERDGSEELPFEIGGVRGNVLDYSMSIVGPGERAKNEWRIARERGLEIGAKVQVNTTWEASTCPTAG